MNFVVHFGCYIFTLITLTGLDGVIIKLNSIGQITKPNTHFEITLFHQHLKPEEIHEYFAESRHFERVQTFIEIYEVLH